MHNHGGGGGGGEGGKGQMGERWGGRRRRERGLWEIQPVGERGKGREGEGVLYTAQESYKSLTLMQMEGGRPALFSPSPELRFSPTKAQCSFHFLPFSSLTVERKLNERLETQQKRRGHFLLHWKHTANL